MSSLPASKAKVRRGGSKYMPLLIRSAYRQKKLNRTEKRQVKRMISSRIETKYYDQVQPAVQVTPLGTIFGALCLPTQGSGITQRVGDAIRYKKMTLMYEVIGADSHNSVRVIVFQYAQSGAPTVSNVLQSIATMPELAMYNHESIQQREIHIMYDKIHEVQGVSFGNQANAVAKRVVKFKFPRRKLEFDTGVVTGDNHIYILVITDSLVASHPEFAYRVRTEYQDA